MVSAPTCMCDVACSWARKDASTAVRRSRCCCGMAEAYRRLPGGSAPRLVPLRALDHDADGARGARCSGRVGGDDTQPQERGAAVAHAGTAGAIDLDRSVRTVAPASVVVTRPTVARRAALAKRPRRFFLRGGTGPVTRAVITHGFAQALRNFRPLRTTDCSDCLGTATISRGAAAVGTTALLVREALPPAFDAVTRQVICWPTSSSPTKLLAVVE